MINKDHEKTCGTERFLVNFIYYTIRIYVRPSMRIFIYYVHVPAGT